MDELEKYYQYLKGAKADVPDTYESFKSTLSDEKSARQYYDYLKANKFDTPEDYDTFSNTFELKKKDSATAPALPSLAAPSTSPAPAVETFDDDFIGLAEKHNELSNATKEMQVFGGGSLSMGTGGNTVPDEEARKQAQPIQNYLTEKGIDPHELYTETKGLTPNDYGKEGFSKQELLIDRKENKEFYDRKVAHLKWRKGLDNLLSESLINNAISSEEYQGLNQAIQSSLNNSNVGDYTQQRGNINYVAGAIKQFGGEKAADILKDYAIEVSKVYGNSYKNRSTTATPTPESNYLTPDAELGYQYLKDVDPEKAKQYERLFIDVKTLKDKPDELKGYNHLMQTLEETGISLQDNAVLEDMNNLNAIAERNGGTTPEQLAEYENLKNKQNELYYAKEELNKKYPDRMEDKVDDAMQEILGQRIGWGNYAGGMAGKAIKNTAQGVWEAVSSPFMSDASNSMRELAIMGEASFDSKVYRTNDKNKGLLTDMLVIEPWLQTEIDKIANDKSLTPQQKEARLYPLLKSNTDQFGRVPIEGGKFNISPSSILYGITDLGATLVPFIGLEVATGGIGGAGAAAKFLRTFTAAAATGFHDEYANALLEGKSQSQAYKDAMGMTAIAAAGMAGAGTANKIKTMFSGSKTSSAKLILSMSDEAIEAALAKGTPKGMRGLAQTLKQRAAATPGMIAGGLKTGLEFETSMTAAKALSSQIYNTPFDAEQTFKQAAINIANFGFIGMLGHVGYKSPTQLQKSTLAKFGENPKGFLGELENLKKDGMAEPEYQHRKDLIERSAEAYKALPKSNAKGKPLTESDKGDYLYNSVIKNEAKKAASNLPPRHAEKAAHTAMVADAKNDILLEKPSYEQLEKRQKQLEKKLEPKKDSDGKSIEIPEKEKQQMEAELEAVNDMIKEVGDVTGLGDPTSPVAKVKAAADEVKIGVWRDAIKNGDEATVNEVLKEISDQWHDEGTRMQAERDYGKTITEEAVKMFPQESKESLSVPAEESGIITLPPKSFPEPTLIGEKTNEIKTPEIPVPETPGDLAGKAVDSPLGETKAGTGGSEPPADKPIDVENDLGNVGRRFTQQMLRTEDLTPEAKEGIRKTLEYAEQTNAMSSTEAERIIKEVGVDRAYELVTDRNNNVNGGVRTTMAQAIIKSYNELAKNAPDEFTRNEYLDKTIQTATFVTEKLATDAGQSIQAFSLWERLSPEAQLRAEIKERKAQVPKQKERAKKDVDKIGNDLQKINEETAEQITKTGKVKKATEKAQGKLAKKGQDKIAKAKAARERIIKKYNSEKGRNLYAGVGLTNEGIEYAGSLIKTYIDEGIGNLEIITDKVLQHLKEASQGKPHPSEVVSQVNEIAKVYLSKAGDMKIAKGLKELEKEVDKLVKDHYTVRGEAKKTLTDKFMDQLGLEKEEAAELAKEIETEFDNIATRKKQDLLDSEIRRLNRVKNKMQGGKPIEKKQVQDEIIKFSNLGAFDNGKLLDVIGEKLGIGEVTKEEAARIIELSEKIQAAPEGSPKRNATAELLKYRANLKGTNWGEVAQGVWYANMLSGYATHIRNLVSTFYNTMTFAAQESINNPMAIPYLAYGITKGFKKGAVEAYHTIKTGQTPIHISKVEVPDVLERQVFKGGLLNPYNYLKYVGRLMKAEDVLLFQGLKEMRATQLAYREAARMGSKNPFSKEVFKKVNELLFNTQERLAEADTQIKAEGLTGAEAKRRRYELMEASRPIQMTEEAYGFAARGTFNHNTEGTLGALSDAISGFLDNSLQVGGSKPLRYLVPFTRIITNVANNTLDFSPVGMVRGAMGRRGLFASEASGKRVKMTPEERRQTIIRASLGIATMATAYALSKNGTIDITGAGPSDIKKKLQLIEQGWMPYSIKIGDTYYSYKLTPMVFGLGVVGSVRDHEQYDKGVDEETLTQRVTLASWDAIKNVGDMTWVNSAAPIMGALAENNPDGAIATLKRSGQNTLKTFVIPNAYTQARQRIEQHFNMPQKDVNTTFQMMIKDIPFARNSMNDKINALGDAVIKDVEIVSSTESKDPVWQYLMDKKGWVAPVNKNTLIIYDEKEGIERLANEDEFYEFSKLRGSLIKKQIQDFIDGKTTLKVIENQQVKDKKSNEVSSDELNKWLTEIKTEATKKAKAELFDKKIKEPPKKVVMVPN